MEVKTETKSKEKKKPLLEAANGMEVGDISIFDSKLEGKELEKLWEREYSRVMNEKYAKNTRSFKEMKDKELSKDYGKNPPIFLIPRSRGKSYKDIEVENADAKDLMFCLISKGFSMQQVSSFTLGPVVGASGGLCVVNSAFSKAIYPFHIEGGGVIDLKRKIFWKPSKNPEREIKWMKGDYMKVDRKKVKAEEWLIENKEEWFEEWDKWRKHVSLASIGNFHWSRNNEKAVAYYSPDEGFMNFQTWKKKCYISPAYSLIQKTRVYEYLTELREKGYPLGLVHPKAREDSKEAAITEQFIRELYDSDTRMSCMPYCVAGLLLGVKP